MIGIERSLADPALAAAAPVLLGVVSVILGLYLAFSMLAAFRFGSDFAALIPRSRGVELLWFSGLIVVWAIFGYSLGVDESFLALEIALALVLSIIHPALAIGFFVIFLFLRPWEISADQMPILAVLPRLYAILAILSSILYLHRSRAFNLRLGLPVFLLLGFAFWVFLSTFIRGDAASAQGVYFDVLFKSVVLFLLISQVIRDEIGLGFLESALIFASLGLSAISIYRTLSTPDLHAARIGSFGLLADPNDISAVMILIFPFAFYSLRKKDSPALLRLICALTLLSSLILLYFAKSRGALLALLVTVAAMFVLSFKSKGRAILGAALALALFLPLSAGFHRSEADLAESSESRLIYWKTSGIMALKSPLFGVGFGGYPENFERYAPAFIESGVRTAHSSWFLALAESGFVGFGLFVSLYLWALSASWKIREKFPELFFSTLGYGIAMSFLSHTYAIYFYILLGIVFAASRKFRAAVPLLLLLCALAGFHAGVARAGDDIAVEVVRGGDKPIGRFIPSAQDKLILKGSRGETLNFQIKLRAGGCVKLAFQTKAGKTAPHGLGARFYEMPYVRTANPSFQGAYVGSHHDPLPPLDDGAFCPDLARGAAQPWSWVWGELRIDPALPPGDYEAVISVKSVESEREIPVQLRVWKMIIPEEPAIPLYAEYSSWYGVLGHFGHAHAMEGKLSQAYQREMREHRIFPVKSWVKVPKTRGDAGGALDLDDLAEVHSSFREVILDSRPAWCLIDFPKPIGGTAAEQARYWQGVDQAISGAGLKGKAFVYLWDEPKRDDYRALLSLAKEVKKQAPDLKILVTTSGYDRAPRMPELEKLIDIYVPVLNDWGVDFNNPKMRRYRFLQDQGKQLWTYLSCMSHGCEGPVDSGLPDWVLDRPSVWIRVMPWVLSRMNLNGFLYYDVDYAYQFYPKKDPWTDLWYFSGNGDGTLFYPGRPGEHGLKEHRPIDSIRVKLWREASFDAEYIRWMEQLHTTPSWWKAQYDTLVKSPQDWSKSYDAYQALRDQAGEYLNAR
ncbi:MAG: O-antigen ligase family protein [Oligoflexia bacterium]|nr:O-antigen ligase family protein [Oligoflexia bacterium]